MNPVRTLAGSIAGLAHSRLQLLAVEGREELARFAWLVIGGCTAVFLAAITLMLSSAAVIIAAGETYRLAAAVVLALLLGGMTVYVVMRVRPVVAAKPVAFGASLAELSEDREVLIERSHESRSAVARSSDEVIRLLNIGLIAYSIGRNLRRLGG